MKIKVRYFASLREAAGVDHEFFEVPDQHSMVGLLFDQIKVKYQFNLGQDLVRASVNGRYASMKTELKSEDEIVFIPPVSGG